VTLGVRGKLFLASLGLIAVTVMPVDLVLSRLLEQDLLQRIRQDLTVRLQLIEKVATENAASGPDWEALAHDLGPRSGCRVTFVRDDGQVVGDSDLSAAQVATVENHADRPEVVEALATGTGASVRFSRTLQERMMYVAIPFGPPGSPVGVVRLAKPLQEVDQAIWDQRRLILGGTLLALLLAIVLSSLASVQMARGVRAIRGVAQRVAAGELQARSPSGSRDELGDLGRALDQLARNLAAALGSAQAERDRLTGILQAMREGVLVLDRQRRIALTNAALREMLLLGNDLLDRPAVEVIRNAELIRLLDDVEAAAAAISREIELGDLKPRRILIHADILSGEPGGFLVVFVDVTELRRLETIRRDFVANVSHELRTPIAAVRSAAETLRRAIDTEPEAARDFIDIIERQGEHLHRLVEDLMDLSRIESRQLRLNPESVRLRALVEHALEPFSERARERRLTIDNAVSEGIPSPLVDRRALEQVLANLIDNAVKYASPGATVTVGAGATSGRARITVTDTGPGIEARHLPRLFERFYRVDPGRSRDLGGTGLGLSIVRHLMEAMAGTVTVESEVGRGSTFTVDLPLAGR
jgi:two-component system, OmpR family, phosphate regulon sensor histidine kinase PhoR